MKPGFPPFLTLLLALFISSSLFAQEETLLTITNAKEEQRLWTLSNLETDIGIQTITAFDYEYDEVHTYSAVNLLTLLSENNIQVGEQLMLVCLDGYSIPFDSSLLESSGAEAYVVFQDHAAEEGENWVPFKHGRDTVTFAPTYMLWANTTEDTLVYDESLNALPRPYQLSSIRLLEPADFEAAMPNEDAPQLVKAGFDHFFDHCIKCHQLNGVGGDLGPVLDRENGLLSVLEEDAIKRLIWNIESFYPETKMPVFTDTFIEEDINAISNYLKWMLNQQAQE